MIMAYLSNDGDDDDFNSTMCCVVCFSPVAISSSWYKGVPDEMLVEGSGGGLSMD